MHICARLPYCIDLLFINFTTRLRKISILKQFYKLLRGFAVRMFIIACALSAFSGCSKDELITGFGTVMDTGTFSTGGCEWALQLTAGYYEPHNLPADFRIHGLAVEVTYSILQPTANCPRGQNYQALIHLHKIKKM